MTDSATIQSTSPVRGMSLAGAVSVGVGAIVGGGILALSGVAFAVAGPSALVAFALNGVIAMLTAISFAEMSAAFPQSGGAYVFAKKVLSVQAAFAVGWVVWFASIVASVLYALGFASFAVLTVQTLWVGAPDWIAGRWPGTALALLAAGYYTFSLLRTSGGGSWINAGKIIVFSLLILGGVWALAARPEIDLGARLTPFFAEGWSGLLQAMGYTFIALQGFDLIAAVAGEVRDAPRTVPRAMIYSLIIALVIYLPLLFIVATVGIPDGDSVTTLAQSQPEAVVAIAARNYLGQFGYWLVIIAGLLSMLSALQANLFAASRVAQSMAADRTMPERLATVSERSGAPTWAILVTAAVVVVILLIVPDVAAAGAAASLIFLITFALAHGTNILMRRRQRARGGSVPGLPAVPIIGAAACLFLAIFQGVAVPAAGAITAVWLTGGGLLYLFLFARRARVFDASAEAEDPQLAQLRGRNPLVLVPIANPANAAAMVGIANAMAPPTFGRVLLLSVVRPPTDWQSGIVPPQLTVAQSVLQEALTASFAAGLSPEALATVASGQWQEIARVARTHRCESLLLGLTNLAEGASTANLEEIMSDVDSDVVVLRAPKGWSLERVQRILVPVGGQHHHNELRARLLTSLCRVPGRHFTYLRLVPTTAEGATERMHRQLRRVVEDELPAWVAKVAETEVLPVDNMADALVAQAAAADLVILGLRKEGRHGRLLGDLSLRIAQETDTALLLINQRG